VLSARAIRGSAGSSRIALALVRGLSAAGHRVTVCADRIDEAAVRRAGGHPCHPLGPALLQRLARRLLGRDLQLALRDRAVRRQRGDLVIGDGDLTRQHVVLVHNIARREVEELGAAATPEHERAAARQEQALRAHAFELAIVNSALTKREFTRRFGVDAQRVAVVHPGVDPVQFSLADRPARRASARTALGFGAEDLVIAFISSGHFVLRGVDVLAATLARLPQPARPGVRLLCAGSDRNAGLLRGELARLGVDVPLLAAPRTGRIQDYYYAADLLFHPAHFETFGLVVTEAAACGCPVLTSRSVGAAEVFTGDGALAVVERPDAGLFAPVLARLLGEPGWRSRVAGSQHAAVQALTWEAYTAAFIARLRACGLL
jgi:UDP-glucose:(heptosyl)LPS alpha-1,3-glucosyltransferase